MVQNIEIGEDYACVGGKNIWHTSVHSSQFGYTTKSILKNNVCILSLQSMSASHYILLTQLNSLAIWGIFMFGAAIAMNLNLGHLVIFSNL